ncbi:MAG: hypothetical protein ACM3QZ_07700 [Solirubrobacterales bacterium]
MTLYNTILESAEWVELTRQENERGPEAVLDEVLEKRNWDNAEMLWVLRRLIFYYATYDGTLKKASKERLFDNFVSLMKGIYMLLDQANPDLDDNIRTYITTKLHDATWGIGQGTRHYLERMEEDQQPIAKMKRTR